MTDGPHSLSRRVTQFNYWLDACLLDSPTEWLTDFEYQHAPKRDNAHINDISKELFAMQIFHPEHDTLTAISRLDRSRAGNQCWRESWTLARGGWANHPASTLTGQTAGEQAWFAWYNMMLIQHVWDKGWCRGDTYVKWQAIWEKVFQSLNAIPVAPAWTRDEDFISSQRACLLYKDPDWYGQFGWTERPTGPSPMTGKWPYKWPTVVLNDDVTRLVTWERGGDL